MKYKIALIALIIALVGIGTAVRINAEETSADTLEAQIQELLSQINDLQSQLDELRKKQSALRQELQETLQLTRSLWQGLRSEEIKLLQEILATDPDIYPEGLTTGYFGPLTAKAVRKFQERYGIVSSGTPETTGWGRVGPKTRAKINSILESGAGKSGKVPPGLLIAPGIRKKLGFTPTPPEGQTLPPGIAKRLGQGTTTTDGDDDDDTTDTIPPVLSDISATSTTATTTAITWSTDEDADSLVKYSTTTPLTASTTVTSMVSDSAFVTSHSLTLNSLTASTTYYYIVTSADEAENTASSSEMSFVTLSE